MAERLADFPDLPPASRRYPWKEWTDGSPWKIQRGADYEVATENMRVNLHVKADSLGRKVRTRKVEGGLVFQFLPSKEAEILVARQEEDPEGTEEALRRLYLDACGIYEAARTEVVIERRDGRRQHYAPIRFKQQIELAAEAGRLPEAIARMVRRPTLGFGHLVRAGRKDLLVETLVSDRRRTYHALFSTETVQKARDRLTALDSPDG